MWAYEIEYRSQNVRSLTQGSHRLEKYLNLEGFLENSLKIKYALKSTGKSLTFTIYRRMQQFLET